MAVTYGVAGVPSQKTINLDALLSTTLSKIRSQLEDQVSTSNSLFKKIRNSGNWKSYDGGYNIEIPVMHALGTADSFSGYDELPTDPIDGITRAIFDWSNLATPITISEDEELDNSGRAKLINLLESKIKQAMMGIEERWAKNFFHGNVDNGGNLYDARVSQLNGSAGVLPIGALVDYDPTAVRTLGNIDQNANTWWRNYQASSSASSTTELIQELDNLFNNCSRGPGGGPDILVCDQKTHELLKIAIWEKTRAEPKVNAEWPFDNFIFRGAMVVWDEFMGDPATGVSNTDTKGTLYMLNSKFFEVRYHARRNFANRPFTTPHNQAAKTSQIIWRGATVVSSRRKHGVIGNIARTLTVS